jgi:hypothetical protein
MDITWGEFKAQIEQAGVTDDALIRWIDINSAALKLQINQRGTRDDPKRFSIFGLDETEI